MKKNQKFKKGAASFYIVAFSTLILLIIATSFAAIIIANITRTSNDDLAQSAYDSALAGVEDAKLAFYNYQNCVKQGAVAAEPRIGEPLSCPAIMWYIEQGGADANNYESCDMVSLILGRTNFGETSTGVIIQESNVANNMQQAYTCVKIDNTPDGYHSSLSASNPIRVVRVKFDGVDASRIKQVKLSWGSDINQVDYKYNNFNPSSNKVYFPSEASATAAANPPAVSLALIQTANDFSLSDFDYTQGNTTNRGMIYLVPTGGDGGTAASKSVAGNYKAGYNSARGVNQISAEGFLTSNDKLGDSSKNLPYAVYCPYPSESSGAEFACSATMDLPDPVGGARSNDTFTFVVGLPYGKPTTDFLLEFFCAADDKCYTEKFSYQNDDGDTITEDRPTEQVSLKDVQIEIDSTGRANDLFRRVTASLESMDDHSLSLLGPLELLKNNNEEKGKEALKKAYRVIEEYNF